MDGTKSILPQSHAKSSGNGPRPRPYDELKHLAHGLSESLEAEALRCQFLPERKRLQLLAGTAERIADCLSGLGVR